MIKYTKFEISFEEKLLERINNSNQETFFEMESESAWKIEIDLGILHDPYAC